MADAKLDPKTETIATKGAAPVRSYTPPAMRHLGSVRELTLKTGKTSDLPTKKTLSTREVKTDIHYLSDADRKEVASHVLGLKLARYFYKPEVEEPGRQLGFILEDAPGAPFSMTESNSVNLYGFASAIAAVVQEQQLTISRLEGEISALRSSLTKQS